MRHIASLHFLIVDNQSRLRIDNNLVAMHFAEAALVDLSIAADHGVSAVGDGDSLGLTVGIEDDDDVLPRIASGMVLQHEAHEEPTPSPSLKGGEKAYFFFFGIFWNL